MAKAYKCDRCGRYIDGDPEVIFAVRDTYTYSYIDAEEHVLCPKCLDKLKMFLEEEPECQS